MGGDELSDLRDRVLADPDNPEAHLRLAEHLLACERYDEAVAAAQRVLQLGQDAPEARFVLGKAWMRLGFPCEAAFQLRQFLGRFPDHGEAGQLFEEVRRATAAVDAVRRANPRELQLEVRSHVIIVTLAGMMAPYTEDGHLREPFERLTLAIARLMQLGNLGCVIDLTRVHFIASFFLSKLLEWRRKLLGERGVMVICGARAEIRELLIASKLSRLITLVDTVDEAISLIRRDSEPTQAG